MSDIVPQNLIQCAFDFEEALQKQCSKCKDFFPATPEYFSRQKSAKSGLRSACKKHDNPTKDRSKYKRERIAQGLCCSCPNPLSPRSKWWCEEHIEKRRQDTAARRVTNPKLASKRSKISAIRARLRVMMKLGGLICAWCGEQDYRALSIDHVHGRTPPHKEPRGLTYKEIYAIDRGEMPLNDYRILCMNCQIMHEYERGRRAIYPEVHAAVLDAGGFIGEGDIHA